jgi:hypothetical protein
MGLGTMVVCFVRLHRTDTDGRLGHEGVSCACLSPVWKVSLTWHLDS